MDDIENFKTLKLFIFVEGHGGNLWNLVFSHHYDLDH